MRSQQTTAQGRNTGHGESIGTNMSISFNQTIRNSQARVCTGSCTISFVHFRLSCFSEWCPTPEAMQRNQACHVISSAKSLNLPAAEFMFIWGLHRQQSRFSQFPSLLLVYSFETESAQNMKNSAISTSLHTLLNRQCLHQ